MGAKLPSTPYFTSQVAGGHPVPMAKEKGQEDGRSSPWPCVSKPGSGGHPIPLEQEKGVLTGEAPPQAQ